eukprot:CAMPEP_0184653272 /NCGR_PEP_ID=MMETSP0308-20130426/10998_1 /TAXON_ID=38269 /ORGANISM="Gloeochaete witrockiana, Strain SAG 46.84" /LENGTH=183 /DNA_ID=CAMNT_0027088639 /DNA_START=53 /DNA_END=604 /DNA_ORIENTATION=-
MDYRFVSTVQVSARSAAARPFNASTKLCSSIRTSSFLPRSTQRTLRTFHSAPSSDVEFQIIRCEEKKGLFGGMNLPGLGNLGAMKELYGKMAEIQKSAQELQTSLASEEVKGSSSNGLVTFVVTGKNEPKGVELAPGATDLSLEELQASIDEAWKDSYTKASALLKDKMMAIASGMVGPTPPS